MPLLLVRDSRAVEDRERYRRAGHVGGLARCRIHGNPGTVEGRRKGGQQSQLLFRTNPLLARQSGVSFKKEIRRPEKCVELAELVGVILGDGTISKYQVSVFLGSRHEQMLAVHVQESIARLFGISASLRLMPRNIYGVIASSRGLVEFLNGIGLHSGDKIRNRAEIPGWIFESSDLRKACLRGLVDTDGSVFVHRHTVRKRVYENLSLSFTSHASLILGGVHRLFSDLNFSPKLNERYGHVFLHRADSVIRYTKEIGSRNPHHLARYQEFMRRGAGVVERPRLEIV